MSSTIKTPPASSGDGRPYVGFEEFIQYQLRLARQGIRGADLLTGMVGAALMVAVYLLIFAVTDHWLIRGGWGATGRYLLWTLFVGVLGWWCWLKIVRPFTQRISQLYAASQIEGASPELQSNLLTLVDLQQAGRPVSPAILEAMERRAAVSLQQVNIDDAVDRHTLTKLSYALLGLVFVLCVYTVASPKSLISSAWRALLPMAEVAPSTRTAILKVTPGDVTVLAHATPDITAELSGVIPEKVQLLYTTADRRVVDEPIQLQDTGEGVNRFRARLVGENGAGLLQNVTYRVEAGDAISPTYAITVRQPPTANVTEVFYDYPAYMQLEDRAQPESAIDAWEGTTVTVRAAANMRIDRAMILFSDTEDTSVKAEELPMTITDGVQLAASWQLKFRADGTFARFYRVQLSRQTEDGEELVTVPTLHTLRIRPDLPPKLDVLYPTSDLEAPTNGTIPVAFEASDPDFLLKSVVMRFEKEGELLPKQELLFDAPPFESKTRGKHLLKLAPFALVPGKTLTFWLEAKDNFEPFADRLVNQTRSARITVTIVEPVAPEQAQQNLDEQQAAADQKLAEADQAMNPPDEPPAGENPDQPPPNPDQPMDQPPEGNPSAEPMPENGDPAAGENPPPMGDNPQNGNRPEDAPGPKRPGQKPNGRNQPGQPQPGEDGQPQPSDPMNADPNGGEPAPNQPASENSPPKPGPSNPGQAKPNQNQPQPNRNQNGNDGNEPATLPNDPAPNQAKPGPQQPPTRRPDKAAPDEALEKVLRRQREREQQRQSGEQPSEAGPEKPETKPGEGKSGEGKPGETKPGETKPGETKPGETKPGETQAKDPKIGKANPSDGPMGPDDKGPSRSGSPNDPMSDSPSNPEGTNPPEGDQPPKPGMNPNNGEKPGPSSADQPKNPGEQPGTKPMPPEGEPGGNSMPPMPGENSSEGTGEPRPMTDPKEPGSKEPGSKEPGSKEPGSKEPGSKEPGSKEPGSKEPGSKEPGSKEPGSKEPGSKEPGSKEPGSKEPGSKEPGSKEPGSKEPGSKEPGSKEPGSKEPGEMPEGVPSDSPTGKPMPMPGERPSDEPKPGEGKPGEGKPGEGKPGEGKPGEGKPGEGKPGEGKPGEGKPGEGKPGEGKPGEGKPGEGKPGEGKPGEGKPGEGAGGPPGGDMPGGEGTDQTVPSRNPGKGAVNGPPKDPGKNPEGTPGDGQTNLPPEEFDLENKKKAAALALEELRDELSRGEVSQELLDDLGYTEEELDSFLKQLDERLNQADDATSPESQAKQRQFDELLKGIDLESEGQFKSGGDQERKATESTGSNRRPAPNKYRQAAEEYNKRIRGDSPKTP